MKVTLRELLVYLVFLVDVCICELRYFVSSCSSFAHCFCLLMFETVRPKTCKTWWSRKWSI